MNSKAAPGPARALIAREAARACIVFVLYLSLYPVWTSVGARAAYLDLVLRPARAFVLATQHFPVQSEPGSFRVQYVDCLVVLALCCLAVSLRVEWKARLRRFAVALCLIYVLHVIGVILGTKSDEARALLKNDGPVLLLPWELQILVMVKYLLYDLGFQLGPFILIGLTAGWNAGLSLRRPAMEATSTGTRDPGVLQEGPAGAVRWRRVSVAALGALVVLAAGLRVWSYARESDPRHLRTHVTLGHRFAQSGQWRQASEQYRAAIGGGSLDGRVWYNLALIETEQGRPAESLRLLRRALEVVEDDGWRERMREAITRLAGSRP